MPAQFGWLLSRLIERWPSPARKELLVNGQRGRSDFVVAG